MRKQRRFCRSRKGIDMRQSEIIRKTAETDICLSLLLDGSGRSSVNTGVGFLDHMLTLFAKHGRFDLDVVCKGDIEVDDHHSVEDIGICLGQAFADALGEGRGIARYGDITLPMDEALILAAVDLGEVIWNMAWKFRRKRLARLIRNWWRNFSLPLCEMQS